MEASSSQSSSGGGWWKWALAGSAIAGTGLVCYYAYNYWGSSNEGDGQPGSKKGPSMDSAEVASRLRLARAVQMQAMPSPLAAAPRRAPAVAASSKSGGATLGGGANSKKLCAECKQPLTGLPQRCSSCKMTYYCSKECQKKAWPEHKNSCKPAGGSKPPAASRDGAAAEATASGASGAAAAANGGQAAASTSAPEPGSAAGTDTSRKAPGATIEESLATVLEESAAQKTDKLESLFETSVMLFLRGDYRGAIEQLLRVQALAKERGETSVEGEVHKWLGHCWSKLADSKKAEQYFLEGVEFGKSKNLPKMEVDCLGGLGMLCRSLNDPARAMMYLGKALELSEQLGDLDLKAGMLCNMGNVLMQVDPEQGLMALQQAVALREVSIEKMHDSGERAGLATAVMEHATAMVNLASALFVCKKWVEAKVAYERALEVFELVEDTDKVVKVLINLANMCELQIKDKADTKKEAAGYRDRLLSFLQEQGLRVPEDTCAVCLDPLHMAKPSEPGKELILLACIHCFHDDCWTKHQKACEDKAESVHCPTCRQPVVMFE